MENPFQPHRLYNRRKDIHARFRGQQYGGISTPADFPAVFIFTGSGGDRIGYGDRWERDGSLRYTGEGQVGDMTMTRGNQAILDHAKNGKDLLVFEKVAHDGTVRFIGSFICAGWDYEPQPDVNGDARQAIVFDLVPIEASKQDSEPDDAFVDVADLGALRERALAAAAPAQAVQQAVRSVYRRSRAVRDYVLARAAGRCEGCAAPAPFQTAEGRPYLEPHHILRLSDGGPDDPRHVAAVCPNCHRRAHFSADAAAFNAELLRRIAALEKVA